jgi:hypothetical protein
MQPVILTTRSTSDFGSYCERRLLRFCFLVT